MSFIKMNELEIDKNSRDCVIIYNFNNKEITTLKNIFRLYGIKDIEVLNRKNADSKISDIINKDITTSEEEGINQKSMVFNNINSMKASAIIDSLKKFRMARPLIAFTTETNINWSIDTLVKHLLEERNAMRSGKTVNH